MIRTVDVRYRSAGALLLSYTYRLSRGELFLEGDQPLPLGTKTRLRLQVPGTAAMNIDGRVGWIRPVALGPGLPVGMGIALGSPIDDHGAVIDALAARFSGFRILVIGEDAPTSAAIGRTIRSNLSCEIVDVRLQFALRSLDSGIGEHGNGGEIDLVFIDLDHEQQQALVVMRQLVDGPFAARVPVIALAHHEQDRAAAAAVGVTEVLGTPPLFSEVRSVVMHGLSCPVAWRIE